MTTALKGTLQATFEAGKPSPLTKDGSCYLALMEFSHTVCISVDAPAELLARYAASDKDVLIGEFWEEAIEFRWDIEKSKIRGLVEGEFAFEIDEYENGPVSVSHFYMESTWERFVLESLIVTRALNGDSEQEIIPMKKCHGFVFEPVLDPEFESFSSGRDMDSETSDDGVAEED